MSGQGDARTPVKTRSQAERRAGGRRTTPPKTPKKTSGARTPRATETKSTPPMKSPQAQGSSNPLAVLSPRRPFTVDIATQVSSRGSSTQVQDAGLSNRTGAGTMTARELGMSNVRGLDTAQGTRPIRSSQIRQRALTNPDADKALAASGLEPKGGRDVSFESSLIAMLKGEDPMEGINPEDASLVPREKFGQTEPRLRKRKIQPLIIGMVSNSSKRRLPPGRFAF